MAEYIDRGDLTIWLNKKSCEFSMNDVAPIGWTLCGLVNELATFPSADVVERKTGKWFMRGGQFRCSVCDSKALWLRKGSTGGWSHEYNSEPSNYCPNCGAQMIGGDDDV